MAKNKNKSKSSKTASSKVPSSSAASPSVFSGPVTLTSTDNVTAGVAAMDLGPTDTPPSTKAKKKEKSKSKSKSSKVEVASPEVASYSKGPTATSTDQAAKATTMGPAPIDLRSLTVFLRYILNMIDPRFGGTCLVETSLINDKCWESKQLRKVLATVEDKGMSKEFYSFLRLSHEVNDVNPIVFSHPYNEGDSKEKIDQFARGTREYIYNASRSSGKSGDAIAVFQEFFKGFSPDQTLSIQVGGGEPIVVKATDSRVLEVKLFQTKNLVMSTVMRTKKDKMVLLDYGVGHIEGASHFLLMFLIPGVVLNPDNTGNNIAVVDMTSMQFGMVGLGLQELFIMDTYDQWRAKISGYAGYIGKGRVAKTIPHTPEVMDIAEWVVDWGREAIVLGCEWCRFCGLPVSDKIQLYCCELCNDEKLKYCYWHQGDQFHHHKAEEAKARVDKGKGKEKA